MSSKPMAGDIKWMARGIKLKLIEDMVNILTNKELLEAAERLAKAIPVIVTRYWKESEIEDTAFTGFATIILLKLLEGSAIEAAKAKGLEVNPLFILALRRALATTFDTIVEAVKDLLAYNECITLKDILEKSEKSGEKKSFPPITYL